ncbi:MAG TPA: allantoicase [Gemmatimonadaceae bacterium]|jgi:allantoicase
MTDFTDLIDVAAERLGTSVLLANDEFFGPKERLIKAAPAEWREGVYDEHGKWMDGWETRRRRNEGYDWCVVRLGIPAIVRGVVVDTAWFRGNYPESCSIDACEVEGTPALSDLTDARRSTWREILPRQPLLGDTRNLFPVDDAQRATHVRLNIYPDGGVARLRVHGEAAPDPRALQPGREVNLAAMELGAYVVVCSDMFFGHRQNLILPGRSTHMGDGWETKRRRGPGHDWTLVRLAARGAIERIEIDTDHYKGNAPGSCAVDYCDAAGATAEQLVDAGSKWSPLVAQTPVQPHTRHAFDAPPGTPPATHVRLSIYPDGGIARMRVIGRVA